MIGMSNAASVGSLFSEVHPDEAVRTRGEAAVQDVQKLGTELQLDRELYDVFAALDAAALDPQARPAARQDADGLPPRRRRPRRRRPARGSPRSTSR